MIHLIFQNINHKIIYWYDYMEMVMTEIIFYYVKRALLYLRLYYSNLIRSTAGAWLDTDFNTQIHQ